MRYGKQPSFARVDVTQRFNFVALRNRDRVGHTMYIQTDQLRFTRLSGEQKAVEVTSSFDAEKSNGVDNEPASVRRTEAIFAFEHSFAKNPTLRAVVVCCVANDAVCDGRGGTTTSFENKKGSPAPEVERHGWRVPQ